MQAHQRRLVVAQWLWLSLLRHADAPMLSEGRLAQTNFTTTLGFPYVLLVLGHASASCSHMRFPARRFSNSPRNMPSTQPCSNLPRPNLAHLVELPEPVMDLPAEFDQVTMERCGLHGPVQFLCIAPLLTNCDLLYTSHCDAVTRGLSCDTPRASLGGSHLLRQAHQGRRVVALAGHFPLSKPPDVTVTC